MREITSRPSEAFEKTHYPRIGLYIDGEWIYDRETWSHVRNPSTENEIAPVPKATQEDLQKALTSSQEGFRIWRNTAPLDRVAIIQKAVALMRERAPEMAKVLTLEHGKTLASAEGEILRSCRYYDWEAGQALRSYGWVMPAIPDFQRQIERHPIGPVVAFTPWNVPMSSYARKTSAALAAGCSIIVKAAEETPGTAVELTKCFEEAGLPPGVLNLVFGDPAEISATLIASPISRLVTLTGSTGVGKHLTELAARAMKPVLMELGGHAPVIVTQSVDAERVGVLAAEAKTRGSGQICASVSRFIVDEKVYAPFVDAFAKTLDAVKVGDGFDPAVQMGPVANDRRFDAARAMVADADKRGGRIASGGQRIGNRGYFFEPTLLSDLPLDADAMRLEPFNPIAAAVSVPDLDAALKIANSVDVGLVGYAFTNDLAEAEHLKRNLDVGALSINHFDTPDSDTPFGGVKDSGIGREGGPTSLDAYMVQKTVLQYTGTL
ncbi:NAD-dependent succinate-semialdehyde dehydrogenase [Celeribacter naphthalenivorans]|uniref:NAD-dependent succinate-semialdehyde dehydrogenase n=1 Tax=Celeribacter naphthalenivorans TaxID=1614694 RepID=UPI001CF9E2CE|nr:NAD-dependent succinate-semialdehyde dehydrogenase [Celeribacter naphthalenivorans]